MELKTNSYCVKLYDQTVLVVMLKTHSFCNMHPLDLLAFFLRQEKERRQSSRPSASVHKSETMLFHFILGMQRKSWPREIIMGMLKLRALDFYLQPAYSAKFFCPRFLCDVFDNSLLDLFY